jgi:uncharacterized protein (DUF302 family)
MTANPIVQGLITRPSNHSPEDTSQRIVAAIEARGMTVAARIDHAKAAQAAGLSLRPTELIIFGNPRGGTPLMQAVQTIGIDLPLKMLVWQDETQRTFVSYNDPAFLAARHDVRDHDAVVSAMASALAAISREAAGDGA